MFSPGVKYSALAALTMSVIIVHLSKPTKATQSTRKYALRLETKIKPIYVTAYVNASSKMECVGGCSLTPGCRTVSWSENLQQCGQSERDTSQWWPSGRDNRFMTDKDWDTYSEIIYPVANFQGADGVHTLTLGQARQLCLDNGTQLANTTQVLAAQSMGFELLHCRCGWFTDGRSGMILQQPMWCHPSYSTGILYCDGPMADAWCVMQ